MGVLGPVAEHLFGELVGRGFQRCLAPLVLTGAEMGDIDPGEAQQGERASFSGLERPLFSALQPRQGEAPADDAVFVEVQEAGQPFFENAPQVGGKHCASVRPRRFIFRFPRGGGDRSAASGEAASATTPASSGAGGTYAASLGAASRSKRHIKSLP